jgi:hypothetical protein
MNVGEAVRKASRSLVVLGKFISVGKSGTYVFAC